MSCKDNNGNCNSKQYNETQSFCQNYFLVIGHGNVSKKSEPVIIPDGYNIITLNQVGLPFDWNNEVLLYEMFSNIKDNTNGSKLEHFTHHQFLKYLTSPAFGNKRYCNFDISIHPPGCKVNDTQIVLRAFDKEKDDKYLVQKTGIYNIPNPNTPDVINSTIIWSKNYLSDPKKWDQIEEYFKEIRRGNGLKVEILGSRIKTQDDMIKMLNGNIVISIKDIVSGRFGGPGTYILPVCRSCNLPPKRIQLLRKTSAETSSLFTNKLLLYIGDSSKDNINISLLQIILLHYCRMLKQMYTKIDHDFTIKTVEKPSFKNIILFKSLLNLLNDFFSIIMKFKANGISTDILNRNNLIDTSKKVNTLLSIFSSFIGKNSLYYAFNFISNQKMLNEIILFIISLEGDMKIKTNFTRQ